MSHTLELVHIDDITVGDTIIRPGGHMTVCACNIAGNSFIGRTLFGDSYKIGTVPVTRVIYKLDKKETST